MLIIAWSVTCLSILPNAFIYLGAAFILQPIRENASKAKLLQLMTGLSPITFWAVNLTFDLITHLCIVTILFVITAILDKDRLFFQSESSATVLYGLLASFGLGIIPFAYLLSYSFSKTFRGFSVMMQICSYLGTIAVAVFSVGDLLLNYFGFQNPALYALYVAFSSVFRILPIFSVLFGYQKLYKLAQFSQYCHGLEKNGQLAMICPVLSVNNTGGLLQGLFVFDFKKSFIIFKS